ncbi:large ribosomal subunit protein mL42-like [Physella acuta]|uniref:large ribosomal subunit protein mL42-like n=1 Tax=Physella acuta TaxID=109671 RepID=UPI0027DC247E|nr:large ribosomal subunit protein mL42-like [Physella acuta]
MALPLFRVCLSKNNLVSGFKLSRQLHLSSLHNKARRPDVALSPNNSMIMCWHPEPEHPYEHTQPLPRDKTELEMNDSVLKVQYLLDEKLKNRPEGPTVNELAQLFHTTKHTFFRRTRIEKTKGSVKYRPKNREGL